MHARISDSCPPGGGAGHRTIARRRSRGPLLPGLTGLLLPMVMAGAGWAEPSPETSNGVPPLPIPTYEEIGLAPFTMPSGATPVGNDTPAAGTPPGDSTGTGGDGSDSPSMTAMMSRSWGEAAAQNAQSLGVNAVAVAATCQIEAGGCQTNPLSSSTTITGTFQMRDDTYTAMMNSALARKPNLVMNTVSGLAGKLDPATQSVAAAEYLRQGAMSLQSNQISNPTVLDVRSYYNFGPGNAANIARAESMDLMSAHVTGLTVAQFRANGIDPATTTVGQWRANVTNKIGPSAASAPVLLDRS